MGKKFGDFTIKELVLNQYNLAPFFCKQFSDYENNTCKNCPMSARDDTCIFDHLDKKNIDIEIDIESRR